MQIWAMQIVLSFAAQVAVLDGALVRDELGCLEDEKYCAEALPSSLMEAIDEMQEAREARGHALQSFQEWLYARTLRSTLEDLLATRRLNTVLEIDEAGDTATALLLLERIQEVKPKESIATAKTLGDRHGWRLSFDSKEDDDQPLPRLAQVKSVDAYCNFMAAQRNQDHLLDLNDKPPDVWCREAKSPTLPEGLALAESQYEEMVVTVTERRPLFKTADGWWHINDVVATMTDAPCDNNDRSEYFFESGQCGEQREIWLHHEAEEIPGSASDADIEPDYQEWVVDEKTWAPWVADGLMGKPTGKLIVKYDHRLPMVRHSYRRMDLKGRTVGKADFEVEGSWLVEVAEVTDESGADFSPFDALEKALSEPHTPKAQAIRAVFHDEEARRAAICSNRTMKLAPQTGVAR